MTKGNATVSSVSATAEPKQKAHKKKNETKPSKKLLNKTDQKWMDNYERLKQYKADHGHTYVSKEDADIYYPFANQGCCTRRGAVVGDRDIFSLAKWCERQRSAKKNGKLREDREQLLDDIDFYFNPNDYVWDMKYEAIKEIKDRVGHVDIPDSPSDH